jgi:hypothetical protein
MGNGSMSGRFLYHRIKVVVTCTLVATDASSKCQAKYGIVYHSSRQAITRGTSPDIHMSGDTIIIMEVNTLES